MNNNPIGIVDSGSGGLTIWQDLVSELPNERTLYVGDHAHVPYSNKTTDEIRARACKIISYLLSQKVKLIVIACNTATVAGIEVYRQKFPGVPIIGVVPVVKTAATQTKKKRFAVLSTQYTARSKYQKALIQSYADHCMVYNIGCPNLVTLIEQGIIGGKRVERELKEILLPLKKKDIDILALGCTHYPFLQQKIQQIIGNSVTILDSGGAVSRHVRRILEHNQIEAEHDNYVGDDDRRSKYHFRTTGESKNVSKIFTILLGSSTGVQHVNI